MLAIRTSVGLFHFRSLSKTALRCERFTRESLRHRQTLKELSKQQTPGPSSGTLPYASDVIPVRPVSDLLRAIGFTVAVGAGSFAIAVVADLERAKRKALNLYDSALETLKTTFSTYGQGQSDNGEVTITWKQLSDGDKTAIILVAMNLAVFGMWKLKSLQPLMWRYFSNSFASRSLCLPMALSAFSHSSLIHCALNMYVVYSFTNVAIDKFLGPDQFWAFYVTAAVVSSFVSLSHKALVRSPVRALGASGAILGLLAYTCMKVPDARLKIVFIPHFDFSAQSAIIGILLFDLAGLVFKFRLFDHAAHLGGTLFGMFYALWGEYLLWDQYGSYIEAAYRSIKGERSA